MTYSLKFHEKALKEWQKLGSQSETKKKLMERLERSHGFKADRLSGLLRPHFIKIRYVHQAIVLVYKVNDNEVTVFVLSVKGKDRLQAYENAEIEHIK